MIVASLDYTCMRANLWSTVLLLAQSAPHPPPPPHQKKKKKKEGGGGGAQGSLCIYSDGSVSTFSEFIDY